MPKFQQIAANIDLGSSLLARLDAIETDTTSLQSQITTLNGQVSTINTTLGSLQTQINTINSRLAAAGIP